jgi:hypothetical protein
MNISYPTIIFGALTIYFGIKFLQIIPTLFRLLAALITRGVKWPGPRIHDTAHRAEVVRERLGTGYQNLFSTFIWNTISVTGAFGYFLLMIIGTSSLFRGYIVIKSTWVLVVSTIVVIFGGQIGFEKARQNKDQVNAVLSDLANKVEPRAVDGQSAEAEYAIEHPLITNLELTTENRKAFDLFYESVRCLQDGNSSRALTLYQEATRVDPLLHKNAREILSKMVLDCSLKEEGSICYWLGIHSEYLSDWKQAAMWYEKAAAAYHKIGYKNRESRVHCNLGNVKMHMTDSSGMEEFEKAIALNPKNGTAQLNIARAYYILGYPDGYGYEQALDAFADAIIADPLTYGPKVISSLREIGYTWEADLEKITQRVERKRSVKRGSGE